MNDLMELNDTDLNYIFLGDKTHSDNACNDSDEDFVLQKSIFYFEQFSIVRTSEGFSIRDYALENKFCISKCEVFMFFWLKRLLYINVILMLLKISML